MSNYPWLSATLVSMGLLGCMSTPDQRAATDQRTVEAVGCTPGAGRCVVNVWVSDCQAPYNGIKTDPEKLSVPDRGLPKNIRWQIASEGYIFASDGIVIIDPDGEFSEPSLSPNGQIFKWKDKHSVTKPPNKEYKYAVRVIKTGEVPRNCTVYDPWIINQ